MLLFHTISSDWCTYVRGNGWEVVVFTVHMMLLCVKFVRSDRSELCVYSLYVVTGVDCVCTVCTQ